MPSVNGPMGRSNASLSMSSIHFDRIWRAPRCFPLGLDSNGPRAMAMALQLLGLPGAVLRGRGVLHAANPLFEELLPELAQDRRDRLHLADANADRLFAEALARMSSARGLPANSIPIPPSPGRLPHV